MKNYIRFISFLLVFCLFGQTLVLAENAEFDTSSVIVVINLACGGGGTRFGQALFRVCGRSRLQALGNGKFGLSFERSACRYLRGGRRKAEKKKQR